MSVKPQAMKKKSAPRKYKKRTTRPRKARDVPDFGEMSCKRTLAVPGSANIGFSTNVLYNLMNTQLTDYPRAALTAPQFQHYRIKKVTLTFKPSSDTFTAGGTATKPNLYYMIDKAGTIPTNCSLEGLKAMGAKPRQLDEKNMSISWRPSVLENVMYAYGGSGSSSSSKYRISPWLATSAFNVSTGPSVVSGIDHLGIYWYVDQQINTIGFQYTIECEIQVQFKKPSMDNLLSTVAAIPAIVAPTNSSPDGVVGGGDGE